MQEVRCLPAPITKREGAGIRDNRGLCDGCQESLGNELLWFRIVVGVM